MDNILSNIRTKQEAEEIFAALDNLSSTLFLTTESKTNYFSHLQPNLQTALTALFNKPVDEANRETIRTQIQQLQEQIRKCKNIQITIAFQPDDDTITAFSSWTKNNAGKDILLDIKVDKTIIAGSIITANGLHKDYSMQKKLSDVFQLQKDKIIGTLNSN